MSTPLAHTHKLLFESTSVIVVLPATQQVNRHRQTLTTQYDSRSNTSQAGAHALRMARYAMARGKLLQQLLQRLATVPETVELARATGLTLPQILYNAQMIRTWSLLLRNAQRQG